MKNRGNVVIPKLLDAVMYVGSPDSRFWNCCDFSKTCLRRITTRYLTHMLLGTLKAGDHTLDLGVDEEETLSLDVEEV